MFNNPALSHKYVKLAQKKISSSKKINYTKISTSNAKSLGLPVIKSSVTNNQFSLSAKNNVAIRKIKELISLSLYFLLLRIK